MTNPSITAKVTVVPDVRAEKEKTPNFENETSFAYKAHNTQLNQQKQYC
jgi:hypothetical protein